ncbi:hypothetical protein LguiA_004946 [Lonicera macranthoides]
MKSCLFIKNNTSLPLGRSTLVKKKGLQAYLGSIIVPYLKVSIWIFRLEYRIQVYNVMILVFWVGGCKCLFGYSTVRPH